MNSGNDDREGAKLHGDKLEPHEDQGKVTSTKNAADLLEIPPHEQPQSDSTKIHGDKLEPHGGQ